MCGDRKFDQFVAMRVAGVSLTELVEEYGKKVAMGFEGIYQKFYNWENMLVEDEEVNLFGLRRAA